VETRQFGRTDLRVSQLGFGCAALGSRTGRKAAADAVAAAVDHGINFFDTAPFYGQGASERILGQVLRGKEPRVLVTTKIGLYPNALLRSAARLRPIVRALLKSMPGMSQEVLQRSVQGFMRSQNEVRFDPRSIRESVEASLRRLRRDYIDLLLLHVTPAPTELEQVMEELEAIRSTGKIRYYGASSSGDAGTTMWLRRERLPVAGLQVMLNPLEIAAMDLCLPLAAEKQIAVIAREPFARGRLLPPRHTSGDSLGFLGERYDSRFEQLAAACNRTVPQLSLQYLNQSSGVTVTLAGMSTAQHVRENTRALELPALTDRVLAKVRELGQQGSIGV
jgi:aryl-alcohol dehydrogenase-like predicted oxidoreductase